MAGRVGSFVHRRVGAARRGRSGGGDAGQRGVEAGQDVGGDVERRSGLQRSAGFDHQIRAAALHDLVDHRAEPGADLLQDVLLVALDLLLLAAQFLIGGVLLGLERADAGGQRRVGLLAVERVDRGLDRRCLRPAARSVSCCWRCPQCRDLALERGRGGPAGGAFAGHPVGIDDGDTRRRDSLRRRGRGKRRELRRSPRLVVRIIFIRIGFLR